MLFILTPARRCLASCCSCFAFFSEHNCSPGFGGGGPVSRDTHKLLGHTSSRGGGVVTSRWWFVQHTAGHHHVGLGASSRGDTTVHWRRRLHLWQSCWRMSLSQIARHGVDAKWWRKCLRKSLVSVFYSLAPPRHRFRSASPETGVRGLRTAALSSRLCCTIRASNHASFFSRSRNPQSGLDQVVAHIMVRSWRSALKPDRGCLSGHATGGGSAHRSGCTVVLRRRCTCAPENSSLAHNIDVLTFASGSTVLHGVPATTVVGTLVFSVLFFACAHQVCDDSRVFILMALAPG